MKRLTTVAAFGLLAFTANVFAAGYEFEGIGVNEANPGRSGDCQRRQLDGYLLESGEINNDR